MVRAIISTFTFCALTVLTTNVLVERSFAPVKKAIVLNSLLRFESIFSEDKAGQNPVMPSEANLKVINAITSTVEEKIEIIELSESDFLPQFEQERLKEEEISFAVVEKDIVVESTDVKLPSTVESPTRERLALVEKSEINGANPITHYGFKNFKQVKTTNLAANFQPIKVEERVLATRLAKSKASINEGKAKQNSIAHNDKSSVAKQDRISTALAATEKSKPEQTRLKNIVAQDAPPKVEELVFFDYSDPTVSGTGETKDEESQKKMTSLAGIQKTIPANTKPSSPAKVSKNELIIKDIVKKMGDDFKNKKSKKTASAAPKKHVPAPEPKPISFVKKMSTQNFSSLYRMTTQSRSINGKNGGTIKDFEIRFADGEDAIERADSTGTIVMRNLLSSDYAVRRGTILAGGHYPMTLDLVLEGQEVNLSVPLITEESFNQAVENQGLTGLGGHILVELDELTEDVELQDGSAYEKKLFLNSSMKVVERDDSDYSHILFIGVVPGNQIISFKTYKEEVTSKMIHVTDQEIYFDFNFYARVEQDGFELYEDNLLAKESGLLSVDENEITDLAYDTKFIKKTVNKLQAKRALYPVGWRKYYELKHMRRPVYVGRWGSHFIDVPSEDYMNFAIASFGAYGLENTCLIQVNLTKQAKTLSYTGRSHAGYMMVEARILDSDGIFYKDLSGESKRIFLQGEEQGTISLKLEYTDGSVDYLQTFCSKKNYVVEQL